MALPKSTVVTSTRKPAKKKLNGHRAMFPDLDLNTPLNEMSPLGQELLKLSIEIAAEGEPLLSADEINEEIARRRSGRT
jgi:hypothetical protein